jgi:hypothetical protein
MDETPQEELARKQNRDAGIYSPQVIEIPAKKQSEGAPISRYGRIKARGKSLTRVKISLTQLPCSNILVLVLSGIAFRLGGQSHKN